MGTTFAYIGFGFLILISIILLIIFMNNMQVQGKKTILEEMYKNGDIGNDIYLKYLTQNNNFK